MVHCNLFSPSAKLLIRAHLPTEFLQSGLVAVRDKAVTIKTDPDIMTTGTIGRARKAPDDTFDVTIIKPRPVRILNVSLGRYAYVVAVIV